MPLTAKGKEILRSMEKTYKSPKKAKQVLYASKNAGKITGIDDAVKPVVDEHLGFAKLENKLAHEKGVSNPSAVAAAIGRKKYGNAGMTKKAAAGKDERRATMLRAFERMYDEWSQEPGGEGAEGVYNLDKPVVPVPLV